MSPQSSAILVPWDPENTAQRQALINQREECGWYKEKVESEWRDKQNKGIKSIFWIVIASSSLPISNSETELLMDTAEQVNTAERRPSQEYFLPVGHISLDAQNPEGEYLDLDLPSSGIFWIKTFYVRKSFQGYGVGRAAMDQVEKMAVREPLNATVLALDTMQRDDQFREDLMINLQGVPKVTNEDWYSRRGYRLINTVQGFYRGIFDTSGKEAETKTVFMRKDLV